MADLILMHGENGKTFFVDKEEYLAHWEWKKPTKYIDKYEKNGKTVYVYENDYKDTKGVDDSKRVTSNGKEVNYVDLRDNTNKAINANASYLDARTGKKVSKFRVNASATLNSFRNNLSKSKEQRKIEKENKKIDDAVDTTVKATEVGAKYVHKLFNNKGFVEYVSDIGSDMVEFGYNVTHTIAKKTPIIQKLIKKGKQKELDISKRMYDMDSDYYEDIKDMSLDSFESRYQMIEDSYKSALKMTEDSYNSSMESAKNWYDSQVEHYSFFDDDTFREFNSKGLKKAEKEYESTAQELKEDYESEKRIAKEQYDKDMKEIVDEYEKATSEADENIAKAKKEYEQRNASIEESYREWIEE